MSPRKRLMKNRGARAVGAAAAAALTVLGAACAPETPPTPPTRLAVTAELTWCGGVIPPPGESWCHTNPMSTTVEVRTDPRTVLTTVTTASDGTASVDVPAGRYQLTVADVPPYMTCDAVVVTAVAEQTTPVAIGCSVMAP